MVQDNHRQLRGRQVADLKLGDFGLTAHSKQERSRCVGLDDPRCLTRPVAQECDRRTQVKNQVIRPLVIDPGLNQHVISRQHLERNDGFALDLVRLGRRL